MRLPVCVAGGAKQHEVKRPYILYTSHTSYQNTIRIRPVHTMNLVNAYCTSSLVHMVSYVCIYIYRLIGS